MLLHVRPLLFLSVCCVCHADGAADVQHILGGLFVLFSVDNQEFFILSSSSEFSHLNRPATTFYSLVGSVEIIFCQVNLSRCIELCNYFILGSCLVTLDSSRRCSDPSLC